MCRPLDGRVCSDENQKDAACPTEGIRDIAIFGFLLMEWMSKDVADLFEKTNYSIPRIGSEHQK
jgi:hypothetical protein